MEYLEKLSENRMAFKSFYQDLIGRKIDGIDELKNSICEDSSNNIKLVDKSFFKRVFNDVTDIKYEKDILVVTFGRGILMKLEGYDLYTDEYYRCCNRTEYRMVRLLGELVERGHIPIRTSPVRVVISPNGLGTDYYTISINQQFCSDTSNIKFRTVRNIHDNGYNCWGGWGGPVRSEFHELRLEQSIMIMLQRMKQLNMQDLSGSINRVNGVIRDYYNNKILELDPIVLATLCVEYDLQDEIIKYYNHSIENNILLVDDLICGDRDGSLILGLTKTNINLKDFISILKTLRDNYTVPKLKIRKGDDN